MSSNDELNELMDRLDAHRAKRAEGQVAVLTDEEQYVADFNKVRAEIIKPTLESLGRQIKSRGHDFKITETEFARQRGSRPIPDEATIKMEIKLSTESGSRANEIEERLPYLLFSTNYRTRKIDLFVSDLTASGGESGKEGEFMVNQFNGMFIQEKFVGLFRKLSKKMS